LQRFVQQHAAWDPMLLWDGARWLLYVLAMPRGGAHAGSFFTRDNYVHGFESKDLHTWRDLGPVIEPSGPDERLCAGNPIYREGRYYVFGSSTIRQFDRRHLDQRVFLAASTDGVHYRRAADFRLDPDPALYPHPCQGPDGDMLFAWRDPFPFQDPLSGRHYLFICTGGERWGRTPAVAVAVAQRLTGPYRLLPDAIRLPYVDNAFGAPVGEIERIQVQYHEGRYYLTFSCWHRLVDEAWLRTSYPRLGAVDDASLYVLESDRVAGPYTLPANCPLVSGSSGSGLYGTCFAWGGGRAFAVGWRTENYTVLVDGSPVTCWSRTKPNGQSNLRIHWPLSREIIRRLRPCLRAARHVLRPSTGIRPMPKPPLPRRPLGASGTRSSSPLRGSSRRKAKQS
jgi:hypothetical protein